MSMIKCPECNHDISDRAMTCPHCGCPVLCVGLPANNKLASALRTLSGICFIGGLVLSAFGARVPTISDNTVSSEFSLATFFTLFLSYAINSILLMGMAHVVDLLCEIYNLVSGNVWDDETKQNKDY